MKVAIVHYHLRRGGVTRIIRHATAALAGIGAETVVLAGEPPAPEIEAQIGAAAVVDVLPALGYARRGDLAEDLAPELRRAAAACLGAPPDLWHFHNHALGKNASLPRTVRALAAAGERILLQIHDFAEDSRPGNYGLLTEALGAGGELGLYPDGPGVHYAVLNRRDRGILTAAGLDPARVHLLPNPIIRDADGGKLPGGPPAPEEALILYPTRAIRRKNIGELLLWAAMAAGTGAGPRFATTLAPANPAERPRYARWVAFARGLRLPVEFAVGERPGASFGALVRSARALVTTSVAEGFGMCFLEPWLFGRPVVGRNLAEITADFAAEGLDLSALYERVDVPLAWVGREALRRKVEAALRAACAAYLRPLPESAVAGAVDRAMGAMVAGESVDFGRLDEELQRGVIERLRAGPAGAPRHEGLDAALPSPDVIARNEAIVRERFSLGGYADRLGSIYTQLLKSPAGAAGLLPAAAVLDRFLAPERLFLLRT